MEKKEMLDEALEAIIVNPMIKLQENLIAATVVGTVAQADQLILKGDNFALSESNKRQQQLNNLNIEAEKLQAIEAEQEQLVNVYKSMNDIRSNINEIVELKNELTAMNLNVLNNKIDKSMLIDLDGLQEIPLHSTDNDNEVDEEDNDYLGPLMTDNHTIVEHQEIYKQPCNSPVFDELQPDEQQQTNEFITKKQLIDLHKSDNKNSFSDSIDSDLSLSYDRQFNKYNTNNKIDDNFESSDDNGKDSGCEVTTITSSATTNTLINNYKNLSNNELIETENENDQMQIKKLNINDIPDDESLEKIIEQVEYYFSNDNILKDAFLLKHVRRNKDGYVSLKLVSSFKRIRQLTKDWRIVGYAIKKLSKKILLNDIETKIKRIEALPLYDETMPSRTIVATDFVNDKITIELISDVFSKYGEIALIRILRAGGTIPSDVRQFINKYPDLQQKECALVEFIESQSARNALEMNSVIKVYEMVAPKKKTGKKISITKLIDNYKYQNYYENDNERNRGGILNDNYHHHNFNKIKRSNSGYGSYNSNKTPQQEQPVHICGSPRKYSFNNENFDHFNRRLSNCSISPDMTQTQQMQPRKYSNCSEGYSSCSDMSRRTSQCSTESSRRPSQCSDILSRRSSNCSDYCLCNNNNNRRLSQCSDIYRRMSQCSEHNRKYSSSSGSSGGNNNMFERKISATQTSPELYQIIGRRGSADSVKLSSTNTTGTNTTDFYPSIRKYSNCYETPMRKLSYNNSEYYNGRKVSTDSGYDRKLSFTSDCSTRSRSNSNLMCGGVGIHSHENVVRTPIGPDGSKGFSSRSRKLGQIIPPV